MHDDLRLTADVQKHKNAATDFFRSLGDVAMALENGGSESVRREGARPVGVGTATIIIASILLGCLFWVFDALLDYITFYRGEGGLDLLILNVPPHDIYMRSCFAVGCLLGLFWPVSWSEVVMLI